MTRFVMTCQVMIRPVVPRLALTRPDWPRLATPDPVWTCHARPPRYDATMTPPSDDIQTITIRLPRDVYEQLRKDAFDQRTSMNALIIDAIRKQQDTP